MEVREPRVTPILGQISFKNLDPTAFEEFCLDLLRRIGFVNCDWRKGTPLPASPSDSGRDIEAICEMEDKDGHRYRDVWFVDCKHYERGVPPDAVQTLLTWSQAEKPAVALIIASGFLSNAAKDYIRRYEEGRPPFRIRYWERPQLHQLLETHPDLIDKHGIVVDPARHRYEVEAAIQEHSDLIWYEEVRTALELANSSVTELDPAVQQRVAAIEQRYDSRRFGPWGAWQHGYNHGVLSALRWVKGESWDALELEQSDE